MTGKYVRYLRRLMAVPRVGRHLAATGLLAGSLAVTGLVPGSVATATAADCTSIGRQIYQAAAAKDQQRLEALRRQYAAQNCSTAAAPAAKSGAVKGGTANSDNTRTRYVNQNGRIVALTEGGSGSDPGSFLKQLFPIFGGAKQAEPQQPDKGGNRPRVLTPKSPAQPAVAAVPATPAAPAANVETYRTYCVRGCDGYYFQIGRASAETDFTRDQAACEKTCPASPVSLYVQRNGDPAAEIVSLQDGQPYNQLPAAFRFRDGRIPGCSCSADAAAPDNMSRPTGVVDVAQPGTAAVTAADPAVVDGAAPADAAAASASASSAEPAAPAKPAISKPPLRVRTVGPTFLQTQ